MRAVAAHTLINSMRYMGGTGFEMEHNLHIGPRAEVKRSAYEVVKFVRLAVVFDKLGEARELLSEYDKGALPYYFLATHPVLCGYTIASLTISMQDLGMERCDYW